MSIKKRLSWKEKNLLSNMRDYHYQKSYLGKRLKNPNIVRNIIRMIRKDLKSKGFSMVEVDSPKKANFIIRFWKIESVDEGNQKVCKRGTTYYVKKLWKYVSRYGERYKPDECIIKFDEWHDVDEVFKPDFHDRFFKVQKKDEF